jgi:hypothetical protein
MKGYHMVGPIIEPHKEREQVLIKLDRMQGAPMRRSTQWERPVRIWKECG